MIDGSFHINQCCVFSNHASGAIWCAFYALVLWAGVNVKGLLDLLHYVNNAFSFEPDDETLEFYALYDSWYPKKQVGLLKLFNEVGIPHEKKETRIWVRAYNHQVTSQSRLFDNNNAV